MQIKRNGENTHDHLKDTADENDADSNGRRNPDVDKKEDVRPFFHADVSNTDGERGDDADEKNDTEIRKERRCDADRQEKKVVRGRKADEREENGKGDRGPKNMLGGLMPDVTQIRCKPCGQDTREKIGKWRTT